MIGIKMIQFLIFTVFFFNYSFAANSSYNVKKFGAKSNGKSDCTKAFLGAWATACSNTTPVTIYVPKGRYLLKNVVFNGRSCTNKEITIRIDGTLVAPSDYNVTGNAGNWLKFNRVIGVSILGGNLDGRGTKLWICKLSGMSCPPGATSLGLYNSNNITINGLSSLNSQLFHIIVYGSQNVNIFNTKIIAHGKSPNTDGINVQLSSAVTILNSRIRTGDDCVSVGAGTSDLWIENVSCGPGHGISLSAFPSWYQSYNLLLPFYSLPMADDAQSTTSNPSKNQLIYPQSQLVSIKLTEANGKHKFLLPLKDMTWRVTSVVNLRFMTSLSQMHHKCNIGSLGRSLQEGGVRNVTVKTAIFTETQNGVRIKTWASGSSNAFVEDVLFQQLQINNASNPIIIDQNYCPRHQNCPTQESGVDVRNITYQDVHGTSASKVGVKFDCSKTKPCTGIQLNRVVLTHNNKPAIASCVNAQGNVSDDAWPGCFI